MLWNHDFPPSPNGYLKIYIYAIASIYISEQFSEKSPRCIIEGEIGARFGSDRSSAWLGSAPRPARRSARRSARFGARFDSDRIGALLGSARLGAWLGYARLGSALGARLGSARRSALGSARLRTPLDSARPAAREWDSVNFGSWLRLDFGVGTQLGIESGFSFAWHWLS